ncbi:MAG: T9SS type A sorting domain-containing protein, partial [Bacteroidota bacterium]
ITIKGNEIKEFNTIGNHSSPIRCRALRSRLISNTIVGGGRDGIFIPAQDCEVAWNDVSDVMRINNDGGLFYVVGNDDNKNTSIHHNWFHDSFGPDYADGRCAGIYLDNDSKGYDVHHNVVWNISWSAVQMNWAANDNDIFNNTFWNAEKAMGIWLNGRVQTGNRIWNNFAEIGPWEGQDIADNVISSVNPFENLAEQDFRPKEGSALVNAGREIPGITDGFRGMAPDVGAYEFGTDLWIPGAPRAGNATTAIPSFLAPALRAQLLPNPASARSFLQFNLPASSKVDWAIISANGQILRRSSLPLLPSGEQQIEIDVQSLPTGSYFIVGRTNAGGFAQKLIVE